MKTTIDVRDRREAQYVRAGLEDPAVRAFVITMGVLGGLPTDADRRRVLSFVHDTIVARQPPLPLEAAE